QTQLADAPQLLELPADYPRPAQQSYCGAHYQHALSAELTAQINQLSRTHNATQYMTLLAAFNVLLYRYTGQHDILVGSPIAGRTQRETEHLIGFFVNTLVLRTRINPDEPHTFTNMLHQTRQTTLAAYAHQDLPFEQLVEALQPERSLSHSPLFQVLLVLQNNATTDLTLPGLDITPIEQDSPIAKFDLTLNAAEVDGTLELTWEYATDLFEPERIERMAAHFTHLLTGLVEQPERDLHTLPLLTTTEIHQLQTWNDTATDYPADQTLVDLFEAQVAQTPDNIAVSFAGNTLTYRALNARANQLAHYLSPQVQPDTLVGICVERSLEMIIGLLGILKAGGAYVPLDPDYPADRLAYMLQDSQVPVLLTQQRLQAQLLDYPGQIVCLDDPALLADQPEHNLPRIAQPHHLAYVIYTSGSTGQPKGVSIEHHNVVHLITWHQQAFAITQTDRASSLANIAFDAAVWEIWPYLSCGAQLHLVPPKISHETSALLSWYTQYEISTAFLPTPLYESMQNQTWPPYLHNLLIGGDRLTHHPQHEQPHRLFNNYGPTENTVVTTCGMIPAQPNATGETPTIGRPIANTRAYLLDQQNQPVPIGIPGELCIAGAGLARGYLNQPALTAEKFIEVELFGQTERLYKTGDLARWLPDGNLEYLGRIDHQVKLRGFRIELGEIEAVLCQQDVVCEAVVVVHERDGNKSLAAYLTAAAGEVPDTATLRDALKARLPDYMVPNSFTVLDTLPLTPNGKIDRKALPEPDQMVLDGSLRTDAEQILAGIWSEVLSCEVTSHQAHFFELGGHSLLATQLTTRIRATFDIEVPLATLFAHPVLADLANWLSQQQRGSTLPAIQPQPAEAPKVPSFAQQRLWFLAQLEGASATYNMPAALRLQGELHLTALRETFVQIVARHESLRHCFVAQDSETVQIHLLPPYDPLTVTDLQHLDEATQTTEITQRAQAHAQQLFDLSTSPLLSLNLLRLTATDAVLLLNMHHVISDGWSINLLIREWITLYTALSQGNTPQLTPLPIQYTDYAAWQREVLAGDVLTAQQTYWQTQLADAPQLLELPADYPRPAQQSYCGSHYQHALSAELTAQINQLSRTHNATQYMTLLAAFNVLLYRYTGQHDILVGSPIAGRTQRETESLIGFFVNTLVLRTRINPTDPQTFTDLLHQTRQTTLAAYAHQDLPFEQLVEALQPERSLSHSPLFQVLFVLQNNASTDLTLPGLDITPITQDSPIAKFDLTLNAAETNGQLALTWEYATDLFRPERIERMAAHFTHLLNGLVEQPDHDIHTLPLLTTAEISQLQTWNDTATDYPADQTLVDLFEAQVEQTPDNLAVSFAGDTLTYRELNAHANQLAHHLRSLTDATGEHPLIQPDTLVGISVERSLEMITGLLGILKAGGAYVPLDPDYPTERLAYMLQDSQVPLLLTQQRLQAQLPDYPGQIGYLDDPALIADQPEHNLPRTAQPHHLAYVIYTSGSTGQPKGCQMTHHNVSRLLAATQDDYQFNADDVWTLFHSYAFDFSVWEIWGAFAYGGQLIIVPQATCRDATAFLNLLITHQVTVLNQTPSAFTALIQADQAQKTENALRWVIFGGEALEPAKLLPWFAKHGEHQPRLVNMYGITETTVHVTHHPLVMGNKQQAASFIGRPLSDLRVYILDTQHQPVPIGIPGELCVAGAGLARGYLNRPELTAEKFIEVDLFGNTERIYKTGDLARWLPDGNLEYLGRIDHQVKLRGFRIELGEIEAVLSQQASVSEVIVVVHERDGNKSLAAYLTAAAGATPDTATLRDALQARLPDYMVPNSFTVMDALPLTPNGKIDRKALPEPAQIQSSGTSIPPCDFIECQLLAIWQKVLGTDQIGIQDDFFAVGGHSLLAMRLISLIRQQFNLPLPVAVLFQQGTVTALAELIRQAESASLPAWSHCVPLQTQGEDVPIYILPGAIGSVLYLQPLAAALGSQQPIYALQTPG
ncbi:MAG: amino acid adenylation domain-containing protein, partial [Pseudomonadota bacterium]